MRILKEHKLNLSLKNNRNYPEITKLHYIVTAMHINSDNTIRPSRQLQYFSSVKMYSFKIILGINVILALLY